MIATVLAVAIATLLSMIIGELVPKNFALALPRQVSKIVIPFQLGFTAVFKPFVRLDEARNLDASGTGLGLSIARDIARSHGGDITLDDSPLGGLRAVIKVPA